METIEVSSDLEDPEVAGTEPASAWTGAKKPKIQSTPTTPGDLGSTARDDTERSSGDIVHGQEQEQDEIEGWDDAKLSKEIDGLRRWMHETSYDEDYASAHDDELWLEFNEEQQTALNQRLALCRIRAHEVTYLLLLSEHLMQNAMARSYKVKLCFWGRCYRSITRLWAKQSC
jgi:hypothetical protein